MRIVVLTLLLLTLTACGARADGPHGLYLMTRYSVGTLTLEAYRFADGAVVRNPIAAVDEIERERTQRPQDVGTYRLDGGKLVMTFDRRPLSSEYEREDGGCFGWDGGSFCPVEPFASGARIDGVYTGGASVGGGAVMSAATLTLRGDGSYALSSVGSVRTGTEAGSFGSSAEEQGRYRIDENALTLIPSGGAEKRFSSFPYDDGSAGPAPRRIYFGGGMLKRQN
ncbi:copper resistance protein NlpE [Tahibacter caeni]|uniref:copper resistance protein NlpE n=1 Tax=Tahibacter caeni TaxID=1453545 RepID=UPI00214725C6|nr:copper resistance protein NlpE [Tahibacter caeni]